MDIHDRSRAEVAEWALDMVLIRSTSYGINVDNYTVMIPLFLSLVQRSALRWGSNNILLDIKRATNETENTWASQGNLINPIFRDSIPKLVTARCESNHAHNTASAWHHYYQAVNGENQRGEGVPLTPFGMNGNQLDFAEITYTQLDGTNFTVRTNSIQAGIFWKTFITGFWDNLAQIRQSSNVSARRLPDYMRAYNHYSDCMEEYGHGFFPPCCREAIHELQDLIEVPRTDFAPPAIVRQHVD